MKNRFYLLSVLIFFMVGCAGVKITRLASPNDYKEGIRFYRSYPYVLISKTEATGTLQAKTVFLPRMNEEYVINVRSGLGTVDASFDLVDGWNLTHFGDKRDSKIPDTITALTGTLKETAAILEKTVGEIPALEPGLYRYSFDLGPESGFVDGLVPVLQFKDVPTKPTKEVPK